MLVGRPGELVLREDAEIVESKVLEGRELMRLVIVCSSWSSSCGYKKCR